MFNSWLGLPNPVAQQRGGCCSSVPSGPTSSKARLLFSTVMHTTTCIEPTHKHIHVDGHRDQHRHMLSNDRSTNSTNGLILFPSLSVQDEGLPVGMYIHIHHVSLFSDSLGRDLISLMALLGFSHLLLCPLLLPVWGDGSLMGRWLLWCPLE